MGVFSVPITVRNWQNQFLPVNQQGKEIHSQAVVDTGAVELALPAENINTLRLQQLDVIKVYTADGGQHKYRIFGIAELEVQNRICQVRVIELPFGTQALLGAVPLEEMDWRVSPLEKKLIGNPKSPDQPLLPLC